MNLRSRLKALEQKGNTPLNLDDMTDEQLARLAGFPPGYVPTDAELLEVMEFGRIPRVEGAARA